MAKSAKIKDAILSVVLGILCLAWVYPIVMILFNSLKKDTAITTSTAFQLPNAESFAGLANYVNALQSKGFLTAFWYSLVITVTSVVLILICCSMCAWFVTRVQTWWSKLCYFLFVFSMVVPFQMLMFTLSSTADRLKLSNPYNICIIYLGFGAGLASFMFCGFMKSIPLEIEEAAMIDGCGDLRFYLTILMPVSKPAIATAFISSFVSMWNIYTWPLLVTKTNEMRTVQVAITMLESTEAATSYGAVMAGTMTVLLPTAVIFLVFRKWIISGATAGAVKG